MKLASKVLCAWLLGCCFVPVFADGAQLSGSINVNQTSETAAKAKNKAMNGAVRQILTNVVSKYANPDAFMNLLNETKDEDLLNFITSSSVANEQISTTGYSAKITMNLDNDAIKNWLVQNNVQNWIPSVESGEQFMISVVLPNGIVDWAELKRIARDNGIEIETKTISGNNIIAKLPVSYRTKFTIAVRDAGWKYSDNDGILQIWK